MPSYIARSVMLDGMFTSIYVYNALQYKVNFFVWAISNSVGNYYKDCKQFG